MFAQKTDSILCNCLKIEGPEKYSYFISEKDSLGIVYVKLINVCDSFALDISHYKAWVLGETITKNLPPKKSGLYKYVFFRLRDFLKNGYNINFKNDSLDNLGKTIPPYPVTYRLSLSNKDNVCIIHEIDTLFQNKPINFNNNNILPLDYFKLLSISLPNKDSVIVKSTPDFGFSILENNTIISTIEIINNSNSIFHLCDIKTGDTTINTKHGFKNCLLFPHKAVLIQYQVSLLDSLFRANIGRILTLNYQMPISLEFCDGQGKNKIIIPFQITFDKKDFLEEH